MLEGARRLAELNIDEREPLVVGLSWWRLYAIHRLAHLPLQRINGKDITATERDRARTLFAPVAKAITAVSRRAGGLRHGGTFFSRWHCFHVFICVFHVTDAAAHARGARQPSFSRPRCWPSW